MIMSRLITFVALIPLVAGHRGLRATRDLQSCDCDPFNYKYDLECCGPACGFPDSQFFDEVLCSCDACDPNGSCYDMDHCCDPCLSTSACYSEEQCCDPCDPESYCFDFYADCDVHYATNTATVTGSVVAATKTIKSSKKGSTASSTTYDETIYESDEEYYDIAERPLYSVNIDAFSPARLGGRSESIGENYPFGGEVTSATDTSDTSVEADVDGETLEISVVHEGYCTRTSDDASVQGFCHWQYTVTDVGTFVASGGLGDPSEPSVFAIEGGTGILIGATGTVTIYGATVNDAGFPSIAASGTDPFSGVDGYLHDIELYADDEFNDGDEGSVVISSPTASAAPSVSQEPTAPTISLAPSIAPSKAPTGKPSTSMSPSVAPSKVPTGAPSTSLSPSVAPSQAPSGAPSKSASPSIIPSSAPSTP